ncbi:FeoA family protein [Planctomicrobium sp. SH664]|uniref:FeoA family protein n=1 Tax=Planctomicrobium sp. SH664 TaxID=3448125 RepID=UPI003F5C2B0B
MNAVIPLESLNDNEAGTIVDIVGPESWRHRLMELGLREGVTVSLTKRGSPCVVSVGDQRLCLRHEPGTTVFVEVTSNASI